jgi:hypothetical protein
MAWNSVESICGTLRRTHCRLNRFGTSNMAMSAPYRLLQDISASPRGPGTSASGRKLSTAGPSARRGSPVGEAPGCSRPSARDDTY